MQGSGAKRVAMLGLLERLRERALLFDREQHVRFHADHQRALHFRFR